MRQRACKALRVIVAHGGLLPFWAFVFVCASVLGCGPDLERLDYGPPSSIAGEACDKDADCVSGHGCSRGFCREYCTRTVECGSEASCLAGVCEPFEGSGWPECGAVTQYTGDSCSTGSYPITRDGSTLPTSDGMDNVTGGDFGDVACGKAGNDTLRGNGGRDYLEGGSGSGGSGGSTDADTIDGGPGFDVLVGGPGADVFVYGDVADAPYQGNNCPIAANVDTIVDFTPGVDKLDLVGIDADKDTLGNQAFTAMPAGATTAGGWSAQYDASSKRTFVVLYQRQQTSGVLAVLIALQGKVLLGDEDVIP